MRTELLQKFEQIYEDNEEARIYFAPGRVNLIGEHTDYNGGHVFPCALTIGTYGVARKRKDRKIRFYSENFKEFGVIESSLDDLTPSKQTRWINYPKGVLWAFKQKGDEIPCGVDFWVWGNIPNGSGLSSSASLEVLTGVMLRDLFDIGQMTMQEIAAISQYSENEFNGMKCGIMDQFASAMGKKDHAIFLDTNTMQFEYIVSEHQTAFGRLGLNCSLRIFCNSVLKSESFVVIVHGLLH